MYPLTFATLPSTLRLEVMSLEDHIELTSSFMTSWWFEGWFAFAVMQVTLPIQQYLIRHCSASFCPWKRTESIVAMDRHLMLLQCEANQYTLESSLEQQAQRGLSNSCFALFRCVATEGHIMRMPYHLGTWINWDQLAVMWFSRPAFNLTYIIRDHRSAWCDATQPTEDVSDLMNQWRLTKIERPPLIDGMGCKTPEVLWLVCWYFFQSRSIR